MQPSQPIESSEPRHDQGVVHGRFQVLHNDHIRYILTAQKLCRHLVIGITNPDPLHSQADPSAPNRDAPLANPLSYWERYQLLIAALKDVGMSLEQYSIVPFPVSFPERYVHYVPLSAVFFLTLLDEWGHKKRRLIESMGLKTQVLWELPPDTKRLTAGLVRQRIMDGRRWYHMVPPSSVALLNQWKIAERLNRVAGYRAPPQ